MLRRYDYITIAAIIAMFITALVVWNRLPDELPVHWNAAGEVDRYGGKFEGLLLMPLMALGTYLLILFLPKIDARRKNQDPMLLSFIALITTLLLVVIYFTTVAIAFGYDIPLPRVLSFAMGILFLLMGNVMPKVQSNWFIGVRTMWTLESEHSWFMTHRLAGWVFSVGGIVLLLTSFFLPMRGLYIPIIVLVVATLLLIPYSYFVWRGDKARASQNT